MRYIKKIYALDSIIRRIRKENPKISNVKLALEIMKTDPDSSTHSIEYVRKVIANWKKLSDDGKNPLPDKGESFTETTENKALKEKSGFEQFGDYFINWSDKTIVTDLGEYGTFVASLNKHKLIQRDYVYEGEGDTAAIVAMNHDFPHMKAVYIYAKIHGFTKSSIQQTDVELMLGKTVEESVQETLQSKKRAIYKKTRKREWSETIKAAEKFWHLENTLLEEINVLVSDLGKNHTRPVALEKVISKGKDDIRFSALIGISDIHYLKLCFDHEGNITYNKDIALARVKDHTQKLAIEFARYGTPQEIYVIVGNDNIHIDGLAHATTRGTPQTDATDSNWRIELKNYIQMQIDMIDYYKQIAPVVLLPVKGNHDFQTSIMLQAFMEIYYAEDDNVDVRVGHDARSYYQYGKVGLIVTHGDEIRSIKALESKIHSLILSEAKAQGIDIQEVDNWLLVHGHEHVDSSRDLNGFVQRIGLPSLSGGKSSDDWWHKSNGYIGRLPESKVILIDPNRGKKAIIYVD